MKEDDSRDDIIQRNVYVNMERDDLDGIPDYPLLPEYRCKWFAPGDERVWVDIHRQAELHTDVTLDLFRRAFGTDEQSLRARQCFLLDSHQTPIATATAWFEGDFHGLPYGRVHWVAVVPQCQGRGLSKPLLTIVLRRMVELGHQRVFLRTSTARLPAIGLYQQFGFVPSLRTADDRDVWSQLNGRLRCPFDM